MHFAENQLSPSLLGLSPLITGHPPSFQPRWVRASTGSYPRFPLPMTRSLGFGSTASDYVALFRLAFAPASPHGLTLPDTITRWLILQKARRRRTSLLRLFVDQWFQVLFHSPPGVLFTFPSRYSCTIGHMMILSFTRWSSQIHTGFHGPGDTRVSVRRCYSLRVRDYYPLWFIFPDDSTAKTLCNSVIVLAHYQTDPTTPEWQRR